MGMYVPLMLQPCGALYVPSILPWAFWTMMSRFDSNVPAISAFVVESRRAPPAQKSPLMEKLELATMIGPLARYVPETGPFSHAISMRSARAIEPEIKSSKFFSELLFGSSRFSFLNLTDLARNPGCTSNEIGASVVEMSRFANSSDATEGSNWTRNEVASTRTVSSESKSAGKVTVI